MNLYARLARTGHDEERRLLADLERWHDRMVFHQRDVERNGADAVCSEDCPHAEGRFLWNEACALLGARAGALTFLRDCATAVRADVRPHETAVAGQARS